jgi:predicted  nucleic acid-binding Zn-ribbon protein
MNDTPTPLDEKSGRKGALLGLLAACIILAIVATILGSRVGHLKTEISDVQAQLAAAKADTAQAQTDLGAAKAAAADLRSQLDKAKTSCTDLQAQVDKAKGESAGLASEVEGAKAQGAKQVAAIQAQLEKANAREADLQGQLGQATAWSTQLQVQLGQAKSRSAFLETKLQKAEGDIAKLQTVAQKARHLPVTTFFDRNGAGFTAHSSYTMSINSLQTEPLKLDITVTNPQRTRTQSSTVEYGATLKVDKLSSGDSVLIASQGFDPLTVAVP